MRIIFMGTPHFAVPTLEGLIHSEHEVVAVITSTDKLGGRGKKQLLESAIKKCALANQIPVLQPKNLKNIDFLEELRSYRADLQVVVAFRMLPVVVWEMPPLGTMNLHGSLLPKYRGAAPINWAIINGDKQTGLTTFMLQHEIDTGDMIDQAVTPIYHEDDAGSLHDRMMGLGAELVLNSVDQIANGSIQLKSQTESDVSKAPKIHHKDCLINFNAPGKSVYDFIRGMAPYPGAYTYLDGKEVKIIKCSLETENNTLSAQAIESNNKNKLHIGTKDYAISIEELKMEGKRKMGISDFLNGYQIQSKEVVNTPSK